jgi:hypothetical protein
LQHSIHYFELSTDTFFIDANHSIQWGVSKIHVVSVVASKSGLETLLSKHPEIDVTVGTVDKDLTVDNDAFPGVGDTGDRLFGTFQNDEDEEAFLHYTKRRRMSDADVNTTAHVRT